jgi:uncharacterized membrane protein
LTAPTALSFIVFSIDGPLGIVLLAMMLGLALLFALYVMSLRTSMFVGGRRHAQELRAQRDLADRAEASRLTELRAHFDSEFEKLRGEIRTMGSQMAMRGDSMQQSLLKSLTETTNTLSAYVAEVDDKLSRALPRLTN